MKRTKNITQNDIGKIKIGWNRFIEDITSLYLSVIRDKFVPTQLYAVEPEDQIVAGIIGDRYDFAVMDEVVSEKPLLVTIVPKADFCYDFLQLETSGKMAVLYDTGVSAIVYDFVGRVVPYDIVFPWKE